MIKWLDTPDNPDDPDELAGLLEAVRARWMDAPTDDDTLVDLLATARTECEAYAPDESDPQHPGGHACRTAQLMHARNIWNASLITPGGGGEFGEAGFTVAVHPLDWAVTQRLRPKRGRKLAI